MCFCKTEELKLIGLHALESVVIGKSSFAKCPYDPSKDGKDPSRHFYLSSCERMKVLKIGTCSFMDYSVCVIENLPSLEMVVMGELKAMSGNFFWASLELKSMLVKLRMISRLTDVKICAVWKYCI